MIDILYTIDIICFYLLSLSIAYLFAFAIASKFYRKRKYIYQGKLNKFAVIFPAYKEDQVIIQSIKSFLNQNYPKEMYDVIIISDQMEESTNDMLKKMPVQLIEASYQNSSKAKAMALAIDSIENKDHDMIVIMDADNTTTPDFLQKMNSMRNTGSKAIQAHRIAKNTGTDIAILDAVSEEINNAFFRKGHVALGFSSALIGSGMALDAKWFKCNVKHLKTFGEDKELEILLLKENIYIDYLDDLFVLDEKILKKEAFRQQRKRWIAAQFDSLKAAIPYFHKALFTGNFDYCDKVLQWIMLPRIILLFLIVVITCLTTIVHPITSLKWWGLSIFTLSTLCIVIPRELYNKQLLRATIQLPGLAWIMFINLLKLKKKNQTFIHTEHQHNS